MKATQSKKSVAVSLRAFGGILFLLAFCGVRDAGAQQISSLPATISQPGSYYLSQNLTHTDRYSNAITVSADNVTIDLKGYTLFGPGATLGTSNGIYMNGRSNVEVRNGTITSFGNNGIWEEDTADVASGHRVIGVRVLSTGGDGIVLLSRDNLVEDCTVSYSCLAITQGYGGIKCGHTSTVVNNVVSQSNGFTGIVTDSGCTIQGNTVSNHGYGIRVWYGCHVIGNTCSWNGDGIWIQRDGNCVKGNNVLSSEANGIEAEGSYNAIEENLVTYCQVGIYFANAQNYYANNRAMANSTNYGGSLPTGAGNGGGNGGFGTSPANMSAQLEMSAGQTFNNVQNADE